MMPIVKEKKKEKVFICTNVQPSQVGIVEYSSFMQLATDLSLRKQL